MFAHINIVKCKKIHIVKGDVVKVETSGDQKERDTLQIKNDVDLEVKQVVSNSNTLNIGSCNNARGSIVININNVSMSSFCVDNSESTLEIVITLPADASIDFTLAGMAQDIFIQEGLNINVVVSGNGTILVGTASKSFKGKISGQGAIRADKANGLLDLKVSGQGDIEIQEFSGDQIEAKVSGMGDILVNKCSARSLNAKISGMGKITVRGSVENVHQKVSGMGSINIT